jgi:V/A-type H+-transporting ATPase subunit F
LYRVCLLADQDLASGFRLAGVGVRVVQTPKQVVDALHELMQDPQVGLVAVQEDFYPWILDTLERDLKGRDLPLVIPFPRPQAEKGRDHIAEMVREAIGYYVKLR